jgi:hypothetical protein
VHRRRTERGGELARAAAEVGLVDDEQRRAELLGEVADVHAGQRDDAAGGAPGSPRPNRGGEGVQVGGRGRARARRLGRG